MRLFRASAIKSFSFSRSHLISSISKQLKFTIATEKSRILFRFVLIKIYKRNQAGLLFRAMQFGIFHYRVSRFTEMGFLLGGLAKRRHSIHLNVNVRSMRKGLKILLHGYSNFMTRIKWNFHMTKLLKSSQKVFVSSSFRREKFTICHGSCCSFHREWRQKRDKRPCTWGNLKPRVFARVFLC